MLSACPALEQDVYRPRRSHLSPYYRCIEAHFEQLEGAWEDMYEKSYGFWRPFVMDVIYSYLDCGDLHFGFARVRRDGCGHEYLLPFSCKRRHFCPSCHQKRVVEFGEWLYGEVLKKVPHRQWVFSIPKRLRIYFLYDRRLAQLVTHIPNKGEQLVRYYGYYSNKSRGLRKKTTAGDELVPALIEAEISTEEFRRNWARLIKKVYHADPLLCPKCSGHMRIISFIEDKETIKKILVHLGLWETRNHDPPPCKVDMHKYLQYYIPEIKETVYDDFSQLTPYDDDYSQVAEEQYS